MFTDNFPKGQLPSLPVYLGWDEKKYKQQLYNIYSPNAPSCQNTLQLCSSSAGVSGSPSQSSSAATQLISSHTKWLALLAPALFLSPEVNTTRPTSTWLNHRDFWLECGPRWSTRAVSPASYLPSRFHGENRLFDLSEVSKPTRRSCTSTSLVPVPHTSLPGSLSRNGASLGWEKLLRLHLFQWTISHKQWASTHSLCRFQCIPQASEFLTYHHPSAPWPFSVRGPWECEDWRSV